MVNVPQAVYPDEAYDSGRELARRFDNDTAAHGMTDQHDALDAEAVYDSNNVLGEGRNRETLAISPGVAVPGEIQAYDAIAG